MKYTRDIKDVWVIRLENGKGSFIIDEQDLVKVKQHLWFAAKAATGITPMCNKKIDGKWRGVRIQKLIFNPPKGMVVDHINGNTLDNRRCNLRVCTPQQNRFNSKTPFNSKTGVKGVSPQGDKFKVGFMCNGKYYYFGLYPTLEEAKKKYKEEIIKYHKEFAYDVR